MSDDWSWPYTDGYTGPYYSDGKFQSSVPNGRTKPKNKLASFSRDHDTDYYYCNGDKSCTDVADVRYYDRTRSMDFIPRVIGAMPLLAHNPSLWLDRRRKMKSLRVNKLGWQGETAKERQKREREFLDEMRRQKEADRVKNKRIVEDNKSYNEEPYADVYQPDLSEKETLAIQKEEEQVPNVVPESTRAAVSGVCYNPYQERSVETQQGSGIASNISEFYRGLPFGKKKKYKPQIKRKLKRLN